MMFFFSFPLSLVPVEFHVDDVEHLFGILPESIYD
jgi:hypothetical protein